MEYSMFMLAFACVLHSMGAGIVCYLLKLYLEHCAEGKEAGIQEPEYVREINNRLNFNDVETERDLL